MRVNLIINVRSHDAGFDESKHKRDHGKFAKGEATSPEQAEHAKKLGLPTAYAGTHASPRLRAHVVNNPLPRAKGVNHERMREISKQIIRQDMPKKTLKLSALRTTQDYVIPSVDEQHRVSLADPENSMAARLPIVAKIGPEYVLLDGTPEASPAGDLPGADHVGRAPVGDHVGGESQKALAMGGSAGPRRY
jgi:hypothetical protein